ncbi:MAG: hypothetical protein AAFX10_14440 [Pseudomonadota bacterium]
MIRIPGLPTPLEPCLERPPVSGDHGLYRYNYARTGKNRQLRTMLQKRKDAS